MKINNQEKTNWNVFSLMKKTELLVVGGGIAGSIAAKEAALNGIETCLLEKKKVPRTKACSGIQFGYFEKIVGAKFPRDILCTNDITRVSIILPNGFKMTAPMKVFNFWRSTFDHWLNGLAQDAGADFLDGTKLKSFEQDQNGVIATVLTANGIKEQIQAKYLVVADGLYSPIRRSMRPAQFTAKPHALAVSHYFKDVDDGSLNRNKLYMYYNLDFGEYMFAWVYYKDDYLVIGSGSRIDVAHQKVEAFVDHVKKTYKFDGTLVKKEGCALSQIGDPYLGDGHILIVGDAAGLCDMYRGVGMDSAAISARHAVNAIIKNENSEKTVFEAYRDNMGKILNTMKRNESKRTDHCATNSELQKILKKTFLKSGLGIVFWSAVNKFLSPEKMVLLPP